MIWNHLVRTGQHILLNARSLGTFASLTTRNRGSYLRVFTVFITVLSKWLINSILWHFKINAVIIILDKSVILGLPLCVFAGYSVLTYASGSLTYWLPDRIKIID